MPIAVWVTLAGAVAYVGMVARDVRGPARWVKVVPAIALATLMPTPLTAAGMALCAAGDALLLDKDRFLLAGLGAFLVGHLAFVAGFREMGLSPVQPALVAALAVVAGGVLFALRARLRGVMRVAVPTYAVVLVAMVASASSLGPVGLAGGLLFLVSDALLAGNLFGRPLPGGHVAVMITYYGALMLLAAAVLT